MCLVYSLWLIDGGVFYFLDRVVGKVYFGKVID